MKRSHVVVISSIFVAALLLYFLVAPRLQTTDVRTIAPGTHGNGSQVPNFSLPDLAGKQVALQDFSDKVLVVDFWATWCPPCLEEIPHLNRLYSQYRSKGFEIVGISMDEDGPEVVRKFVDRFEVEYPIVMGNYEVTDDFGGIDGLPTTFIVDKKGTIIKRYSGYSPVMMEEMETIIKDLLG